MPEQQKPYYELELAAFLDADGLRAIPIVDLQAGDALDAIKEHVFAELNIPHHTEDAVYCYVFHLFNKPNSEPAIGEALLLQAIIEKVHTIWGDRCTRVEVEHG